MPSVSCPCRAIASSEYPDTYSTRMSGRNGRAWPTSSLPLIRGMTTSVTMRSIAPWYWVTTRSASAPSAASSTR